MASTEKCFRVNVFLATVDRACGQIKQQFLSFSYFTATFNVLMPSTLLIASYDELFVAAALLAIAIRHLYFTSFSRPAVVISVKLWFTVAFSKEIFKIEMVFKRPVFYKRCFSKEVFSIEVFLKEMVSKNVVFKRVLFKLMTH